MKRLDNLLLAVLISTIACSCAPKPYAASNKVYRSKLKEINRQVSSRVTGIDTLGLQASWIGTVNFNMRKPNFVILHHTAQGSCGQTVNTFINERTEVSSHYIVCRDGSVVQMLNDYLRGWHAGAGRWGNVTDLNSVSLGIEIDNNGSEEYPPAQISSLIKLLGGLQSKYNIPAANFIGHGDIAPARKVDPGILFPWKQLAEAGFGLWYKDTSSIQVPDSFNVASALRIIGYDVRDEIKASEAFRRHYILSDNKGVLTLSERKVLFAVMKEYF